MPTIKADVRKIRDELGNVYLIPINTEDGGCQFPQEECTCEKPICPKCERPITLLDNGGYVCLGCNREPPC